MRCLRGLRLSGSHASCASLSLASSRLSPFGSQPPRRPLVLSLVPRSHGWRGWQKQAGAPSASWRPSASERLQLKGCAETLAYTGFPQEHWRRIRTSNAIECTSREIRRRTRVVGTFPDERSALMLVTARLKYVAESEWGSRRYLDVSLLHE